ncbi:MAG: tetratricopeptide repeat protein [Magnetococcales bacterium]|nr:tetratricopeptide repeat protein [Magnetococcales bacterium]
MEKHSTSAKENGRSITVEAAYLAALECYNSEEYNEANRFCSVILKAAPDHVAAINLTGLIAQKLYRDELAVEQFNRAININGDVVLLYYNLGCSLYRLGKKEEAINSLNIALQKEPDNAQIKNLIDKIKNKKQTKTEDENPFSTAQHLLQKGVGLHQEQKHVEAIQCYKKVVDLQPDSYQALFNMGTAFHSIGKLDHAIANYQKAITIKPEYIDVYCNLALLLQQQNRRKNAIDILNKGIALKGDFALSHVILGDILHEENRVDEAVGCYEKANVLDKKNSAVYVKLGNIFKSKSKYKKAIQNYREAITIDHDLVEAHYNIAIIYQEQGQLADAITSYKNALAIKPDLSVAHSNIAQILKEQGELKKAIASYQQAIIIDPNFIAAHFNLANTLKEQGLLSKAVSSFQNVLSLKPDYAQAHNNLGNTFKEQGELEKAVLSYQKAIDINVEYAEAYNNLGIAFQELGKLQDAQLNYQKALAVKADFALAYRNLSLVKKYSDISEIKTMQNLLLKFTDDDDKMNINFALGKAMADIKHDKEAFDFFIEGNRLKRKTIQYDTAWVNNSVKQFKKTFDRSFFAAKNGYGCKDKTPIFIVGMPRSGSTLIEQILASHPEVYGAGELPYLVESLKTDFLSNRTKVLIDKISQLSPTNAENLGIEYTKKTGLLAANKKYITDKMPGNFLYIGVIKLILPKAKIIHSVRSAEDTSLSIFKTLFSQKHNYAYNLTEIGEFYRIYADLMRYWHNLFPGEIYDVHYEKLTEKQEEETRKLLDFCELKWDNNCLNFHKTNRSVSTASNYQVRQKIYTSSVNGWRRFESQLQPLITALGEFSSTKTKPDNNW